MERERNGSSPLTRGTLQPNLNLICRKRFIPAYAGNSATCATGTRKSSVHPRLRGELFKNFVTIFRSIGSSPLTRGTQQKLRAFRFNRRFIPAYAGNSVTGVSAGNRRTVHPRLRGELGTLLTEEKIEFGSSPLTRGTLIVCIVFRKISRFIPAYAGNSFNLFE